MSNLETKAANERWFSRFWTRYVDNILAIIKRGTENHILEKLNEMSPTIKFTFVLEYEEKIPFLDLLIYRNNGLIEFDIYRKPQQIQRYIPASSNHPESHKKAAFESMVYRLLHTPLSDSRSMKEIVYIKETAVINGYKATMIDDLIAKHKKRISIKDFTQLTPLSKTPTSKPFLTPWRESRTAFVELPRTKFTSDRLQKVLRRQGINCYYTSQGNL